MNKKSISPKISSARRWWYGVARFFTISVILGAMLIVGFIAGIFASVSKVLPKGDELSSIVLPVPTRILAIDGTLLAKVHDQSENREIVPLNRMGQNIMLATLAIEDERYYSHPGIDLRGIARALVKNVSAGGAREGASTITQQVARGLYLSPKKNITRKLQEIVLALELERHFSKDEILETYLNQICYGSNHYGLQSYGAQMAARNYFDKDAKDITLAEAALLAGMPKSPTEYNPYNHLDKAVNRRNLVLATMRDNGVISDADYQQAKAETVKLAPEKTISQTADCFAPYFVDYIKRQELERRYGAEDAARMLKAGMIIYTTLDPRMQKVAEDEVSQQIKANKSRNIDEGALVSIDPKTGYIKAMVGGINYTVSKFNVVSQGFRQPGSCFKPFVYTTALMNCYTPETTVKDELRKYPAGGGKFWSPKNSDGSYNGSMPLKKALWNSRNAAAASIAADVGIKNIIETAYTMGIGNKDKHPLQPYLSTALGASEVSPLDLCSAYGTLANGGVHNPYTGIIRITTSTGEVIYENTPQPERAIPEDIANTMQTMMRGVIDHGTGTAARCPFPASGKTGTTNSYKDAWFSGYTDDLCTVVWVGNRDSSPMNRTFGGTVPAPIWREYMKIAQPIMVDEHAQMKSDFDSYKPVKTKATHSSSNDNATSKPANKSGDNADKTGTKSNEPEGTPTAPAVKPKENDKPPVIKTTRMLTVVVCSESGKIATGACPHPVARHFSPGSEPRESCPLHRD